MATGSSCSHGCLLVFHNVLRIEENTHGVFFTVFIAERHTGARDNLTHLFFEDCKSCKVPAMEKSTLSFTVGLVRVATELVVSARCVVGGGSVDENLKNREVASEFLPDRTRQEVQFLVGIYDLVLSGFDDRRDLLHEPKNVGLFEGVVENRFRFVESIERDDKVTAGVRFQVAGLDELQERFGDDAGAILVGDVELVHHRHFVVGVLDDDFIEFTDL